MRTGPAFFPLTFLFALALAACGGGQEGAGKTPTPEAGFVKVHGETFTMPGSERRARSRHFLMPFGSCRVGTHSLS